MLNKKIPVLPKGVEPVTFWTTVRMLYHWAIWASWELGHYSEVRLTMATQQSFWLVFDNFVTSFWQLSDGFSLYLANKNARTVRGGVVNCRKANMALITLPPPVLAFLLASLKGSHQKVVKKMSQSCQILVKNFFGWPVIDMVDWKLGIWDKHPAYC